MQIFFRLWRAAEEWKENKRKNGTLLIGPDEWLCAVPLSQMIVCFIWLNVDFTGVVSTIISDDTDRERIYARNWKWNPCSSGACFKDVASLLPPPDLYYLRRDAVPAFRNWWTISASRLVVSPLTDPVADTDRSWSWWFNVDRSQFWYIRQRGFLRPKRFCIRHWSLAIFAESCRDGVEIWISCCKTIKLSANADWLVFDPFLYLHFF